MTQASINRHHRYLIKENATGNYVGSTDNLGQPLEAGFVMVDTIGTDGLGTLRGNKGIPDFLRARANGLLP